jgi:hypothetical protein
VLFGALYLCFLAAKHVGQLPSFARRRPQLALHGVMWLGVVLAAIIPARGGVGGAVLLMTAATLPFLVWRCGYMLMAAKRGKISGTGFRDHLLYLWPAYGGTNVPFGKGYDYLARRDAPSAEARARAQLAGLKLLVLALLWRLAILVLDGAVAGDPGNPVNRLLGGRSLGVPHLENLIGGGEDSPGSLPVAWVALYAELVRRTLEVAVLGHLVVGSLRLCGFNVYRNTYKPLLSESIVDFWNRYYFYFKELLVDFFFFPAYLKCFRTRPRLRIFVATFAAAGLGNLYYTALRDVDAIIAGDLPGLGQRLGPRVLYCGLLATGIFLSMLRQQRLRATGAALASRWGSLGTVRRVAGVWTFYGLIHIWNVQSDALVLTFVQRTVFFLRLFGLS